MQQNTPDQQNDLVNLTTELKAVLNRYPQLHHEFTREADLIELFVRPVVLKKHINYPKRYEGERSGWKTSHYMNPPAELKNSLLSHRKKESKNIAELILSKKKAVK